MSTIRVHIAVVDGLLTAFRNRTNNNKFDKRGGWEDGFGMDLQRVGGNGTGWNGTSWKMFRTAAEAPADAPDWETFLADVVQSAQTNTGEANVQVAWSIHEDDYPGMEPLAGFNLFLADTAKNHWGLERVPPP